MHEILHGADKYHIYIYIYTQICQFRPVAPSNCRVVFASIVHTFNHTVCNTCLMELNLTIIFLQNICLKGRIPLFTNYVFFVLLFHSHERAYCIHAVMSLLQMIIIHIHFYFRDRKMKKLKPLEKKNITFR